MCCSFKNHHITPYLRGLTGPLGLAVKLAAPHNRRRHPIETSKKVLLVCCPALTILEVRPHHLNTLARSTRLCREYCADPPPSTHLMPKTQDARSAPESAMPVYGRARARTQARSTCECPTPCALGHGPPPGEAPTDGVTPRSSTSRWCTVLS